MNEKIITSDENIFFWILTFNDEIISISKGFNTITEFNINEIQGKHINELWKMLGFNSVLDCSGKLVNNEHFLFTKSDLRKTITISQEETNDNYTMYIIKEKNELEFEAKFSYISQIINKNLFAAAIYKMPEIILVKASQKFLDFLDEPFNSAEVSIGRFLGDIVTGWRGSPREEFWRELIRTQKFFIVDEYKCDRFNKGENYFSSYFTPIFENGKLEYYVETINYITDRVLNRKKIEEQNRVIKEQNRKLEAIIENISDTILLIDEKMEFSRLNKGAWEFPNAELGNSCEEWFNYARYLDEHGIEIKWENSPLKKLTRGEPIKDTYITLDEGNNQRHMVINGTPIMNEGGEFQNGIMCIRDVTEHVSKQLELNRQRDIFHNIISNLDIPILRLSYPDFKVVGYNNKFYENLNSIDEGMPIDINRLNMYESLFDIKQHYGEHIILDNIKKVIETKNVVYLEKLETVQRGERKICKFIFQPLLDINGEVFEIIITSYDITNIIEEKEGLEKLLKMQEEFFSFISHEFKTPLSVISSASQAMELLCKNELGQVGNNLLDKIKRSTLQQIRLVNNLLDIARADAGYLKLHKKNLNMVEITELIINSVEPFANEKGVIIDFNSDYDNMIMLIDDEKYERILLNLLSNAIKFTPKGRKIYVDLFKESERVFIEVKDEGIGIPREKQQIVFDRFEQSENGYARNSNGTGIGLCLVKLLVEAMGGEIILNSEEGEGASFKIMLPMDCSEEEEVNTAQYNLMDNRLVEVRNIEFSNIYLD